MEWPLELVEDANQHIVDRIPEILYPCGWCSTDKGYPPSQLTWLDYADKFLCDDCLTRILKTRGRQKWDLVPLVSVIEYRQQLELAAENNE